MSNDNNPQAPTPAPAELAAPPPEDQHVQTVQVQLAGNMNTILAEEQAVAEKFVKRAVVYHREIESEEKLTNVKKAYEGCLYILGKRQLQSAEGDKTQGEIFEKLLEKSKLKKSTVYKRIQLAEALINADVITLKLLLQIEEEEKASPELKGLLDKRVGSKKGVEIQQKLGLLPSTEPKKIKPKLGKTAREQIDENSTQIAVLLAKTKSLMEGKELRSEIKDKTMLESLRTQYAAMEMAVMKFKNFGLSFALPEGFGNPAE